MSMKANVYITLADMAAWLKIKATKVQSASPDYDAQLTAVLELLGNAACTKVESIIKTTVLAKDFTEYHDGNNSNVIVPHHWPVVQVTDLRIDTLRQFPDPTSVNSINYFLRAQADKRQASSDLSLRLLGTDVVIRDDNEKYIIGRLFMGSALGSIQLKYKAGWGLSADDVPSDIKLATLQLVEFYYIQRDNRDINVTSKSVKGESYSKVKDEIPAQILDLLAPYEDVSLGDHPQPQRNTFKI